MIESMLYLRIHVYTYFSPEVVHTVYVPTRKLFLVTILKVINNLNLIMYLNDTSFPSEYLLVI